MRTHLDLFSGIGGFALAARWVGGIETIGFSEIDEYCSKILKQHWPGVPNFGDVRTIPCEQLAGRVWLVTGGFPCQPFSLAGLRGGSGDDRFLWPAMCGVIQKAGPTWILAENVPGIIGMELDRVLTDLEAIGYQCQTFVVPACAVDAKHRRDRVWIVAHSECSQWRPNDDGAGRACEGRNGEREAPGWTGERSQILADTESERRGEARGLRREQSKEWIAGSGEDVPNSNVSGLEIGKEQPAREEREAAQRSGEALGDSARRLRHGRRNAGARRRGQSSDSGEDVPNAERLQREQLGAAGRVGRVEEPIPWHRGGSWPVEPELGRVATGVTAVIEKP